MVRYPRNLSRELISSCLTECMPRFYDELVLLRSGSSTTESTTITVVPLLKLILTRVCPFDRHCKAHQIQSNVRTPVHSAGAKFIENLTDFWPPTSVAIVIPVTVSSYENLQNMRVYTVFVLMKSWTGVKRDFAGLRVKGCKSTWTWGTLAQWPMSAFSQPISRVNSGLHT